MLTDPKRFPRLAALLDDDAFSIDTFRTNYKRAKARLETHAGFADRSMADAVESADRFSAHTKEFVTRHDAVPDEAAERIATAIDKVETACKAKDQRAIEEATAELAKAAAHPISAVYVASSAAPPRRRSRWQQRRRRSTAIGPP